ncbi:putative transcription factor/ chromatin remodeling BED-type(Zn) family [Rosa chinensis]|uniref:Putative transcription factor/ chromatin remodeling BED-type(Zn) family n=1 Tax=Rosa chinensis TaxID=74649 RepID=A0A2P6PKU9_ROSCH|nr:putative transcription factor/ chromatin remodeling BED-type(Zn) family [Rosa chinensis]
MAGTTSSSASNPISELGSSLKRGLGDIGWEYAELADASNLDRLKCKLCGKLVSGGIYRMKQHIAHIKGNVAPCKKSSDKDKAKCKNAIEEAKSKKKQKSRHEAEVRQEVIFEGDEDNEASQGTRRMPHTLGPMDRFATPIDPDSSLDGSRKMRQQNINDALFKQRTHSVHQYLARWVYEAGIPFHAVDSDSFKRFVEVVGQFGPGYRPPSQYQLREPLLKEEVERTKSLLKKQEEEWALNGCSIMTDAWSDRKRRSIMNLCVNCAEGTTFLSSKEASDEAHTGTYIFEYVDKCIEDVGPQNVVQVVTDNASNNMAAIDLMKLKRPNIFWTSCATHTLNLMLQGIGNQPRFKGVIERAKSFTIYIYAHHKTLALMRKFTKKRDIVRPGVTRFATAFLTLQSLMEKKNELRAMITSDEWNESKHAKSVKGKAAMNIALSASFWNGVSLCLKVFAPLVKVLRLVDGDRKPSMGFVYGELLRAKEEIKMAFKDQETHYRPILDIVDGKARGRLDSPLHLAGYLLNPYYTYANPGLENDNVVMDGFFTCVETFFPDDIQTQSLVTNVELHKYLKKDDGFGRGLAKAGCAQNDDTYNPVLWWNIYGNLVPRLQSMAKRILSLTTSSSGCERNWSAFEEIYTKKRNRLDTTRLNNLVYV